MEVSEFRNCVASALIDGTGHFAALDMCDTDVHKRSGDRGGQRFITVPNQKYDIGFQTLIFAGEFAYPIADRLGDRCRR